jgi:hypothetical protein
MDVHYMATDGDALTKAMDTPHILIVKYQIFNIFWTMG